MTVLAIALADFRQRTRQFSVLVLAAIGLYAGTLIVPDAAAPYFALDLSGHRGVYNSAWVSGACAFVLVTLLAFGGLFPARGALERDRLLKTGEIVAASPVSSGAFVLGKWLSSTAFLASVCAVAVCGAAAMQLLRGEDGHLDVLRYGADFALIVVVFCALVAAVAVLFDAVAALRGVFGGIAYVMWFFWACLAASAIRIRGTPLDPLGFATVLGSMSEAVHRAFGLRDVSQQLIGQKAAGAAVATFVWDGVVWDARTVAARAACLALALALALLAAKRFDRYARDARDGTRGLFITQRFPALVAGSPVAAELAVALAGTRAPFAVLAASVAVVSVAVPLDAAWHAVAPVLAILPLAAWSSLGVRDARYGTEELVAASARSRTALMTSRWIAGTLFGALAWLPLLLRTLLAGEAAAAAGAALVMLTALAACALALGAWTRSPRAFEGLFLVAWFLGPLNHLRALDFVGALSAAPLAAAAWGGVIALAALALALAAGRAR